MNPKDFATANNAKSARCTVWCACAGFMLCVSHAGIANVASAADVEVFPQQVELNDEFARQQLLINADGHDATRNSQYVSRNPKIVSVDSVGYLTPKSNGTAQIEVTTAGKQILVPVQVTGLDQIRPVDFATEIEPIMSRFGCNAGGCHGKQSGQNGFKLSLFGFDTDFDYHALVSEGRGRRGMVSAPEKSLLLM